MTIKRSRWPWRFWRKFVRGMSENISNLEKFIKNARGYIELLKQHIEKENDILYPMVNMHISREKDNELLKEFDKLEIERISQGKHEEFHKMLEKLEGIYVEK